MRVDGTARREKVVVYTTRISPKFARLAGTWRARASRRRSSSIETGGRVGGAPAGWAPSPPRRRERPDLPASGWRYVTASTVNAPEALAAIARVRTVGGRERRRRHSPSTGARASSPRHAQRAHGHPARLPGNERGRMGRPQRRSRRLQRLLVGSGHRYWPIIVTHHGRRRRLSID